MLRRAANVFLGRPWPTNHLPDRLLRCRHSTAIVRATSETDHRRKAGRRNLYLANSQFTISRNGNPTDSSSSRMGSHHHSSNSTTDNTLARLSSNTRSRCARRLQAEAQVDVVQAAWAAMARDAARHGGGLDC